MSAIKQDSILIDVTQGDCVQANRRDGKSNTGTYFISSLKNFDSFAKYFDDHNVYKFDLTKIKIYCKLFDTYFMKYKDDYIGKMQDFAKYRNLFLTIKENPNVLVRTRMNDTRVFMRFVDNTENFTNAFRNLLYENLSYICIEKKDDIFYVYPTINDKLLQDKVDTLTGFVLDE